MCFKNSREARIGFAVEDMVSEVDLLEGATFKEGPSKLYSRHGDYTLMVNGEPWVKEIKADNYPNSINFPFEYAHQVNGIWMPSGHEVTSARVIEVYRFSNDSSYITQYHLWNKFIEDETINSNLSTICNADGNVPTKCYMLNYDYFESLGFFSHVRRNVLLNFTKDELSKIFMPTKGIKLNLPKNKAGLIEI